MNAPARRPDASMDLLNNILRQPLDPDYTPEAARDPRKRSRFAVAVVFVVAGALLSGGAAQTARSAPAAAEERAQLIALIEAENASVDETRTRLTELQEQNRTLREQQLGGDQESRRIAEELSLLETSVGARAVTGPGLIVTLNDASGGSSAGVVIDLDVRQAANGLWTAGAEAIAINGHRLSSRTAIRGAGDAITVDYRSLTAPYRIEAIGDPATLRTRFEASAGAAWLKYLRETHHITYEISSADRLTLPADPGLSLTHAEPVHQ
jgi:uncharacterized protein YlxW (UPF0749 family)